MVDALRELFARAVPTPGTAAVVGSAALIGSLLAGRLLGACKIRRGWRTGDTRKLFHALVFGGAAIVQGLVGFAGVCVYGVVVSAVILAALGRGTGDPLFEALARESDAPHRSWYVLVPWIATALGGLLANLFFPGVVIFGYLAVGLGDAVGEPVGLRIGRTRYRLPLPARATSWRSLEGSAAVFLACAVAAAVGLAAGGRAGEVAPLAGRIALFALLCTAVEAAAPHGWDNLFLQLAGSGAADLLFSV
jgi:phytol kinase